MFSKIKEITSRIRFWQTADRIGPDMPITYWMLYFKSSMKRLCQKKFKYFADDAEFRPGAYATGCSKISIGKRVIVRPLSIIESDTSSDGAEIIIEDDVLLAPGIHIYTNNHQFMNESLPIIEQGYYDVQKVILKKGCWIGANSIILPGVIIGQNSVIGAGSIVTRSIPDFAVAVGSPARVIKKIKSGTRTENVKNDYQN